MQRKTHGCPKAPTCLWGLALTAAIFQSTHAVAKPKFAGAQFAEQPPPAEAPAADLTRYLAGEAVHAKAETVALA